MFFLLATLFLGTAWCRDNSKFKTLPTISNSLVNLGKMDVAFHFNSRYPDMASTDGPGPASNTFFFSKTDQPDLEPCPCSSIKNSKMSPNPFEFINKLFKSNELFPHNNRESITSISCCDSHEHVLEDTVYFEYRPKPGQNNMEVPPNTGHTNTLPMIPLIYDSFVPNRPSLPSVPAKPKAIEIFFFPKKKDLNQFDISKLQFPKHDLINNKKVDIQIVGDKEIRNDFKTYKYLPSLPAKSLKTEVNSNVITKSTTESNNVDVSSLITENSTILI